MMEIWLQSQPLWWSAIVLLLLGATLFSVSRWLWTPLLLLLAGGMVWMTEMAVVSAVVLFLVAIVPALLALLGPLRRLVLVRPMMAFYRRAMPEISDTERAALEAGSTWWDAELFTGRPDWNQLLRFPKATLSKEERDFLDGPTERLCALLDDYKIDNVTRDLPQEAWDLIRSERFFGMVIPREYGGLGFSQYGHAAVVMKIASRSISAALTVMIPNSVGPAKLLLKYGSTAQKQYYIPRLARAEDIPCFALTSNDAGSDAGSLQDSGVVCKQDHAGQQDVLGIRLNFDKRYITLAPVATLLGVAFRLQDPEGLLGGEKELGITLALVPADAPGVEKGYRHDPNQMSFMNGPVRGKDVFIPLENIIGGREFVGRGWRMLMESLTDGRAISLPALSTATAKTSHRLATAYARVREQFGVAIADFEGIQEKLGRLAGNTHAMDAARLVTLAALDEGHKPSVISAIMKYNMTERARDAVNDAVEIHGGAAVCLGPRNPLGQFQRFPAIGITVEGHNILTRTLITFGQGAIRCHPHLLDELNAVQGQVSGSPLKAFDRALCGHVGHALGNGLRAVVLGLTDGRFSAAPATAPRSLRRWYRRLNRASASFAVITDLLLLSYRGELKRKEQLSGRMADALSQLYLASTVLKHAHDRDYPQATADAMNWALHDSLARFHRAIDTLSRNVGGFTGWLIRRLAFPVGGRWHDVPDALVRSLAASVSHGGEARALLSEGMYIPPAGSADRMDVLEQAMRAMEESAGLRRKLRKAIRKGAVTPILGDYKATVEAAQAAGLVDDREARQLIRTEELRFEAIRVDEFAELGSRLEEGGRVSGMG
ncbi:acyl-CoA dehydrogenase [Natronospira bacteriovora]|uniref:Acyl-coenzyme A dehydrogenase n=1 Tax=Natronospira bacteriovora TaxID=3069753 RepID=A0ABU0W8W3_9GAMM|nr:acyl-CoA dehydrogenase [Natronospira sp. AB-CW4]MDQ2070397.1 acyl-CoA dehydrogenase [Natronospira sp. AB-CW4]